MTRKLTTEEIRILAKVERRMDAGEVPSVVWNGGRMMVQQIMMDELGLETGQTVSHEIAGAILNANLAACRAAVAAEKLTQK